MAIVKRKNCKDNNDENYRQAAISYIVNWACDVPVDPQDDIFPDQLNAIEAYYDEDIPEEAFDDARKAAPILKDFLQKKDYWDIVNLGEYLEDEFKTPILPKRNADGTIQKYLDEKAPVKDAAKKPKNWTVMWIENRNDITYTAASIVHNVLTAEEAKEAVKQKHPKASITRVAEGRLIWEAEDIWPHIKTEDSDDDIEPLRVCEHCLAGIEAHEGRMFTKKIEFDEDDGKCDWCEEEGFDTLYEILDKQDPSVQDSDDDVDTIRVEKGEYLGYTPEDYVLAEVFTENGWKPWGLVVKTNEDKFVEKIKNQYDRYRFREIEVVDAAVEDAAPDDIGKISVSLEEVKSQHELYETKDYTNDEAGKDAAIREMWDFIINDPKIATRYLNNELQVRYNSKF